MSHRSSALLTPCSGCQHNGCECLSAAAREEAPPASPLPSVPSSLAHSGVFQANGAGEQGETEQVCGGEHEGRFRGLLLERADNASWV